MSNEESLDAKDSDLYSYLRSKLLGSSLQVIPVSESEVHVDAGDIVSIKILINEAKKTIDFSLFSKILNRPVTVEHISGAAFMEARLEEELEKENRTTIGEDSLLCVDLIYLWSKEHDYSVTHGGVVETGREEPVPQRKKKPTSK